MTGKGLSWCAYFPNDRAEAMMTLEDIRERDAQLCAEIERLRRQGVHLADALEAGRAEIERLQAGWKTAFNIGVSEQEQNKKLRAEIERQRKELEIWKRNGGDILLRAEIERLRAALQMFAKCFGPLEDNHMLSDECRNCFALARAALEPKP